MEELYERLKTEYYLYCLGKKPSVLMASCRYVEGLLKTKTYKTKVEVCREYEVSETALTQRFREIINLLKLEITFWDGICKFCGRKIRCNPKHKNKGNVCFTCRRSYTKYIWKKWKYANVCIICGELNPLFLLPTGHHIFGKENSRLTIPICANCHELTKPRSRQSFFLFDNWKSPKTKFTEDNSKIYIHI